jgi:hypothetical protein
MINTWNLEALGYISMHLVGSYYYSETWTHCFQWESWTSGIVLENDRCGSHSLNKICSGTTVIERSIRENDTSGNDISKFHCIRKSQ